jgi:hypothetical protein
VRPAQRAPASSARRQKQHRQQAGNNFIFNKHMCPGAYGSLRGAVRELARNGRKPLPLLDFPFYPKRGAAAHMSLRHKQSKNV